MIICSHGTKSMLSIRIMSQSLIDKIFSIGAFSMRALKFLFPVGGIRHTFQTIAQSGAWPDLEGVGPSLKLDAYPCALEESASGFPYLPSNYFTCFPKDRIFFLNIKDLRYVLSNLRHNILNPFHPDLPLKIQDKLSNPTNL